MATIDSILDDVASLDVESREMLLDILTMRQIEERRDQIVKNAKKALKEYRAGKLKSQTAEEAIKELNSL